MKFYGTSAAEGIPSPFCRCRVCENARKTGGKEIRRRSMFRIDESTCIDMGADAFQLAVEFGDFFNLKHAIITHTHEDHFAHMMMNIRNMAASPAPETLNIYFTDKAYDIVDFYRKNSSINKGLTADMEAKGVIAFHKLLFEKPYRIGDINVTAYRGNHYGNMGENSANYLFQMGDGRKIYYGLDTGWYLEDTFKLLEKAELDIFISECTVGLKEGRGEHPEGHLDAFSNVLLFQELLKREIITPKTDIYLTHINQTSTHQELVDYFAAACHTVPNRITVAYDGLRVQ